jgi:hypothetical protein
MTLPRYPTWLTQSPESIIAKQKELGSEGCQLVLLSFSFPCRKEMSDSKHVPIFRRYPPSLRTPYGAELTTLPVWPSCASSTLMCRASLYDLWTLGWGMHMHIASPRKDRTEQDCDERTVLLVPYIRIPDSGNAETPYLLIVIYFRSFT